MFTRFFARSLVIFALCLSGSAATAQSFGQNPNSPVSANSALSLADGYGGRMVMVDLSAKCGFLTPDARLAAIAFAAQARSAALRAGATDSQLARVRANARARAASLNCRQPEVQAEAARMTRAFGAWRASLRSQLPGQFRVWEVSRAGLDPWRVWQVLAGNSFANEVRAGLINFRGAWRFAIEVPNQDVIMVRLYQRDRNIIGPPRAGGLFQAPIPSALKQHLAADLAGGMMVERVSTPARAGTVAVFSITDTREIIRADSRDVLSVEVVTRSHGTLNYLVDVGDLVVGYAASIIG